MITLDTREDVSHTVKLVASLFYIPSMLVIYIIFEAVTGKTLGKHITGTKVVNEYGDRPSFGQVLGRSFARLIPLEALSFFGTPTRGWHDSLTGTYVVKEKAVNDQYQADQLEQDRHDLGAKSPRNHI